MPLDGIFLHTIANEISIIGARVEKVYQPSKEEIIISLKSKNDKSKKLLLSANANSPRIHFTNIQLENPTTPPMFCMLLRKHLNTAKLMAVRQDGLDRILSLDFETVNELGDLTTITIIIEIMGRHSNIILINAEGKVIDSIKRVGNDVSSVRMILPGVTYTAPPKQNKINILQCDIDTALSEFYKYPNNDVAKSFLQVFEGLSPLLARELSYLALKGQAIEKDKLSDFYKDRIKEVLSNFIQDIKQNNIKITSISDENIKLRDFTCINLEQYGSSPVKTVFDDCGSLLDWYYFENDRMTRAKQKANDLLKFLMNTSERISKKLALQKNELLQCADREHFRVCGDILNANLYKLEKGMSSVCLDNFYDNSKIEIKLDPRLTPVKNAQKYYNEYRKAQTAEKMLTELIKKAEQELIYIESVFDCVSRISGESEIVEIREELISEGYIRHNVKKNKMLKPLPPIKYISSDGFTIFCGRNNKQNDKLTLKTAKGNDIWLHTKDIPGSHVIIVTEGNEVTEETIYQAAIIAANNSKGRNSSRVAVDYTNVKYVKKPNGAKPGMVIFSQNKTMFVTPDFDLEAKLKV